MVPAKVDHTIVETVFVEAFQAFTVAVAVEYIVSVTLMSFVCAIVWNCVCWTVCVWVTY